MLDLNCYAVLEQCVTFVNRLPRRDRGGIICLLCLVGGQGVARLANYKSHSSGHVELHDGRFTSRESGFYADGNNMRTISIQHFQSLIRTE